MTRATSARRDTGRHPLTRVVAAIAILIALVAIVAAIALGTPKPHDTHTIDRVPITSPSTKAPTPTRGASPSPIPTTIATPSPTAPVRPAKPVAPPVAGNPHGTTTTTCALSVLGVVRICTGAP